MAYACGDCFPQYKVEEVNPVEGIGNELKGKEIEVRFVSNDTEANYEKEAGACMICYTHIFKGKLTKSIWKDNWIFWAEEYSLSLLSNSCCSHTDSLDLIIP
ncbi:MAG: hypothetical protein H6581_02645 [Bacteroidia bacterium]|nr:hypothetical protein [Bacteroidia bacterium]